MLIIGTQASLENPKMDAFKLSFIKKPSKRSHVPTYNSAGNPSHLIVSMDSNDSILTKLDSTVAFHQTGNGQLI